VKGLVSGRSQVYCFVADACRSKYIALATVGRTSQATSLFKTSLGKSLPKKVEEHSEFREQCTSNISYTIAHSRESNQNAVAP